MAEIATGESRKWSAAKFSRLFKERAKAAKKAGGRFSYEVIAAAVGVSRSAVAEWISGESRPSVDSYFALRDFLGVKDEDLTE